jgi:hypothetical protein
MIKFVCELWQVDGFIDTLVPPPIKLTTHDIAEMLLKVALSTITLTLVLVDGRYFVSEKG